MLPSASDTRAALRGTTVQPDIGADAFDADDYRHCDSRSLMLERFARPELREQPRHAFFHHAFAKRVDPVKSRSWTDWLAAVSREDACPILYAQLQSRLVVNVAGGVMENAGLCLDRFGLPYIPGSAVKGCARRAALAALREWGETGSQPGTTPGDEDNLFTGACQLFQSPAAMLAGIGRVFGWCEQDWEARSDFAWAAGGKAQDALMGAAAQLARELGLPISPKADDAPWSVLPNYGGAVSFLPAHPVAVPGGPATLPRSCPPLGQLELDVVTCHHREYYDQPDPKRHPGEWARWRDRWSSAPDTEEPVPVVFPAVAAGHVFALGLARLRDCTDADLRAARAWLACGLRTFGLGAKTNAGYGWFEDVTTQVRKSLEAESKQKAEELRLAKEAADRQAARANLQPDPALLEKLRAMKEPDLRGKLNPFATEERFWSEPDERVQYTLLHFLREIVPGSLAADRGNPKSKVAKAIANLSAKFPGSTAPQP